MKSLEATAGARAESFSERDRLSDDALTDIAARVQSPEVVAFLERAADRIAAGEQDPLPRSL